MSSKAKIIFGLIIFIFLAATACILHYSRNVLGPPPDCYTGEKKLCSDGKTYVGQKIPSCEFAQCPEIVGLEDKIIITAPVKNSIISSPVIISGKAHGPWFFEGSFPVDVYDANDKLLGQKYASFVPSPEEPEWMTEDFVNFSGTVEFSKPTTETGYILFKKDNPSDMRELDESYKLPVNFSGSDTDENKSKAEKCYNELNNLQGTGAYMPNPASVFCKCMGGVGGVVTAADGGQSGTCTIDGKTQDEWEYFHKMNPNENDNKL
jgi:putative hemolysin